MGPPPRRPHAMHAQGPPRFAAALLAGALLLACTPGPAGPGLPPGAPSSGSEPVLVALPSVASAGGKGAETVSVQADAARLALSNSEEGTVEVYDLADPERPRLMAVHDLRLAPGEEPTCVAVHPSLDLYLVVVRAADPTAAGHLRAHALSSGALLARVPVGVEPDSVSVDPTGRFALVANEAEAFVPGASGRPESAAGSLTWVAFGPDGSLARVEELALSDGSGAAGLSGPEQGRTLEREVAGREREIPLAGGTPDWLEPEVVAFAPDGRRAVVTLQENDGALLVDAEAPAILATWGLGRTRHRADLREDGEVRIDEPFEALREPDGVAFTPDGRFFVTADEGDTGPKPSRTAPGLPCGGGRTLSVFDARTGACLGDTGAALDRAAAAVGTYPDDRSDNRGCEPEMVVCFAEDGRSFALVTLERADALALVDLGDPAHPQVLSVARTEGEGEHAPEGLAAYRAPDGRLFAYSANEESGRLGVFRVVFPPAR